jgi:hypothetical protein
MAEWTDLPQHGDNMPHDHNKSPQGVDGCPPYCPKKIAFNALSERDRQGLYLKPLPDVVQTLNEFAVRTGRNLPNHTVSIDGKPKYVQVGPYMLRTKQQVYRLAAWLIESADAHDLPDEPGSHTVEQVREAIRNV